MKFAFVRFTQEILRSGALLIALAIAGPVYGQYNSNDVTPPTTPAGKLAGAGTGHQVGGGTDGHAYLLNGNALTAVDLHPAGWINSIALATDDTQQCGYAFSSASGDHSVLWSGSASTFVDLHNLFTWTYCTGVH